MAVSSISQSSAASCTTIPSSEVIKEWQVGNKRIFLIRVKDELKCQVFEKDKLIGENLLEIPSHLSIEDAIKHICKLTPTFLSENNLHFGHVHASSVEQMDVQNIRSTREKAWYQFSAILRLAMKVAMLALFGFAAFKIVHCFTLMDPHFGWNVSLGLGITPKTLLSGSIFCLFCSLPLV